MSRLHWIDLSAGRRMAIMARPRPDDWLDVDVSLLEPEEVSELGLQREAALCRTHGIEFLSFPIADRGVPELPDAIKIASCIAAGIADGRSIAIHCRAGIGRSSIVAACAMICSGIEAGDALTLLKEARGLSVPDTEEQRDWIFAFGETCQHR